jgi:hypothetical protein
MTRGKRRCRAARTTCRADSVVVVDPIKTLTTHADRDAQVTGKARKRLHQPGVLRTHGDPASRGKRGLAGGEELLFDEGILLDDLVFAQLAGRAPPAGDRVGLPGVSE